MRRLGPGRSLGPQNEVTLLDGKRISHLIEKDEGEEHIFSKRGLKAGKGPGIGQIGKSATI